MVSMKDIAAACGVSVATVSKAFANHKDIGESTRKRILKTAKEMGYIPNAASRALKTHKTYNIGVLFTDESQSGLKHDYFAEVLDSFKQTIEQHGYDMTFINCCRTRQTRMSYLEHSRYRGFDGVAIACVNFYDPEVLELVRSDIPVVTIDHLFYNKTAVLSDNVNGMKDLLTFIYRKGHQRIAYIHGADSAVTQNRLASFYRTAQELGIDVPQAYIKEAAYRDTNAAFDRTLELLSLDCPPTCILYPDDFSSFGGINAIRQKGWKIPQEISVAGYDGIRIGRHLEPQLTTLWQDTTQIGLQAAQKLIEQIAHPRTAIAQTIIVPGHVYVGKTVGDIS